MFNRCIKYEVKFNLDYFFLYDKYFDEKVVLECFYIYLVNIFC